VARRLVLTAALVAALLPVAGAGGGNTQTPKRGGTLVFGTQGAQGGLREPPCLNALLDTCITTGVLTHYISQKVLLGAYEAQPDVTWRPRLVSRTDFTRKPPFTLTYHIRPEARWSDGVPVSARDFVFTDRAIRALGERRLDVDHVAQVRSVRAVDAKTVRVVLRSRFAEWRSFFGTVLPSHALAGENLERIFSDGIDNPKRGTPIGSGPFLVERWDRGTQIVLRRNPGYWGLRRAYLDRIAVRYRMSSLEPVEWLRSGEVDIAHHFRLTGVPALRQEPGVTIAPGLTSSFEHLTLRVDGPGGHPALRKKLVRRALVHGIDRAALIRESPVAGAAPALRPLESVVFYPQSPYYRPKWSQYRHSPQVARQLLEQAGCRRGGDGVYSCDGERLRLRMVSPAGFPTRARVDSLVQAQLREIGIELVLEFYASGPLFAQIIPSGNWDLAHFAWFQPVPYPSGMHGVYGCGASDNVGGYCQRLVTRDLDQATRILDAGDQARALNRADAQIAKDVPVIPLFQVPFPAAAKAHVRNVVLSPFNPLWNAENWWLDR
jgi:peptide/nickel transport system substrate-binding protein